MTEGHVLWAKGITTSQLIRFKCRTDAYLTFHEGFADDESWNLQGSYVSECQIDNRYDSCLVKSFSSANIAQPSWTNGIHAPRFDQSYYQLDYDICSSV